MEYLTFILCLIFTWIVIHFSLFIIQSKLRRLPPGPTPMPIFGNLFSLGSSPHITLARLAKTYGPIMKLQMGQVPTVVISSAAVAKEVLQKNDLLLSHRMVADAVNALDHHKRSIVWLPVSDQWRNLCKICNTKLFTTARLEASQTLRRNKVNDLVLHVKECSRGGLAVNNGQAGFTTSLNLLSNTFFSMDLSDTSSKIASELKEIVQGIMDEVGKSTFADYFPLMKKIDPQGIRRRTSVHFGRWIELFNTIIEQRLQERKSSGSVQSNDVLDILLGIDQDKAEEIEPSHIPSLLMDLFSAGTDTTSSTLEWAMAELIHSPKKLKKAQAELEQIIGKGNPVESDIERLPYIQAVMKETLRLHPAELIR